jgi:hypothetical protein
MVGRLAVLPRPALWRALGISHTALRESFFNLLILRRIMRALGFSPASPAILFSTKALDLLLDLLSGQGRLGLHTLLLGRGGLRYASGLFL